MKKIATSLLALALGASIMFGVVEIGRADTPSPVLLAQVTPDAGALTVPAFEPATDTSTDAPAPSSTKPSDTLHDPTTEPGATWDDVKAAKKTGWTAAVFAVLLVLGRLASKAKSIAPLAWLGKGRTAVVVAGALAVLAGCYDAAIQGGSWMSIATAAAVTLAAFWNSHPAPKA